VNRKLVLFIGAISAACSQDPEGKVSSVAKPVDPRDVVVQTDLDDGATWAGVWHPVTCRAFRKPATPGGGLGEEVALPGSATVAVVEGPAGPLHVEAGRAAFAKAGSYRLQCVVQAQVAGKPLELKDETGNWLDVVAAPAVAIDTAVLEPPEVIAQPDKVAAGTVVEIACKALDPFGNAPTSGVVSLAGTAGAGPLELAGSGAMWLHLDKVGTWHPACKAFQPAGTLKEWAKAQHVQKDALQQHQDVLIDKTPPALTVVVGPPKHLFTLLDPPKVPAGNAASLTCVANDAFGNPVDEFPFALDHAQEVQIKGLFASSTQAGLWKVQCVPENDEWTNYTLHPATLTVAPGAATKLELLPLPKKPVYKREEMVQFLTTVKDQFANVRADDEVLLSVTQPKNGWTKLDPKQFQFDEDATYTVLGQVLGAPNVEATVAVLVDGAPPLLTLDEPAWGTTLAGKPATLVKGTVGDAGAGVKSLTLNGKAAFADIEGKWAKQQALNHGLTMLEALATDQGGEKARATRGCYWSSKWYQTRAEDPQAAMVKHGIAVALGKDFFDDGVHDPTKPDDMATLMELVMTSIDPNLLVPGPVAQGDAEVTLSNIQFGKPQVVLTPVDGGLHATIAIPNISSDLKVKAKQKIGPIKVTVKLSGDVKIAKITVATLLAIDVTDGKAKTGAGDTTATIDGLKIHVDGIAGLFDFVFNAILEAYKGKMQSEIIVQVEKTLPKLLDGLTKQLTVAQTLPLPPLAPGLKSATVQVVTAVDALKFSPAGAWLGVDATFVAPKQTPHVTLGAMGRGGCPGLAEKPLEVDAKERIQMALHDDVLNQALHAVWLTGAMEAKNVSGKALGLKADPKVPFPIDEATFALDFFLPPVLESCGVADPAQVKLQVGDAYGQVTLPIGDGLDLGVLVSLDATAKLELTKDSKGSKLAVTPQGQPTVQAELVYITKDFASEKATFEKLILGELDKAVKKGVPGLDKLALDLPQLDLSALAPGLPPGQKIGLQVKAMTRVGGYTVMKAALE
jgi:hypothetical protein